MKILEFIGIKEDPKIKEFREMVEFNHREFVRQACVENGGWLLDCDLREAKDAVETHQRLKTERECHIFMNKKHCYHKGKERITNI
jgi:hypothetical protein